MSIVPLFGVDNLNIKVVHPDALNLGILLCLLTGIRIGELCALTWEKISISERNIYICQTMQRIQNRVPGSKKTHIEIASPKSSSANRNIPISNLLFGFLERYSLSHTGFFLSGSPSKFIEPRCIQRRFHKILDACGYSRLILFFFKASASSASWYQLAIFESDF